MSVLTDTIGYYIGGDYNQPITLYEDNDLTVVESSLQVADTFTCVLMDRLKRPISSEVSINSSEIGSDLPNGIIVVLFDDVETATWKPGTAQILVKRIADATGRKFYYPIFPFVEIIRSPI